MPKTKPNYVLVVARAENGAIWKDNDLPRRIPSDFTRFRNLTLGHPVIMGRKNWESLKRPFPGRTNIVMTRQAGYEAPGAIVVNSIEQACSEAAAAPGGETVFIIGGEDIYRQFLLYAQTVLVTVIYADVAGDTFFPDLGEGWNRTNAAKKWQWRKTDEYETSFHIYERK